MMSTLYDNVFVNIVSINELNIKNWCFSSLSFHAHDVQCYLSPGNGLVLLDNKPLSVHTLTQCHI